MIAPTASASSVRMVSPASPLLNFDHEKQQPHWHDWKWQFRQRIKTVDALRQYLPLSPEEEMAFHRGGINLPFAITPYYLDLICPNNPNDPIRKTVVPLAAEFITSPHEYADPCGEDGASPVPGLVHRYPDRVLFLVNETCSVYCRYCTRSRLVGSGEHRVDEDAVYHYLETHPAIRDVLISGGDPLVMDDAKLERILSRLKAIPHLEVIRLGTKVPTVMPQRITPALVAMLRRYSPLYMSIHFTHPSEITPAVTDACNRLADAGVMTFSQTVLLKGVNDDAAVMKTLMQQILKLRVRPYYLYQCDPVEGTGHFRTRIEDGLAIMEQLRGHMTGYAVPTFVVDAPGGGGKIPLQPNYVVRHDDDHWVLRNFRGQEYHYQS
ncbi:MAG: KamA family radical SAM protein [Candidatus Melainabacteria bacterium]|nr:KamA family radical SAM protein [Candidatus Melainabacteria bacterium]